MFELVLAEDGTTALVARTAPFAVAALGLDAKADTGSGGGAAFFFFQGGVFGISSSSESESDSLVYLGVETTRDGGGEGAFDEFAGTLGFSPLESDSESESSLGTLGEAG